MWYFAIWNSVTLDLINVIRCTQLLDGLLVLGLISLDILISLHFLISIYLERNYEDNDNFKNVMCHVNGYLTVYCLVTIIAYADCLAHCVLEMVSDFQMRKYTSGLQYHIFANSVGIIFCIIMAITDDAGLGVLGTCAMESGSFVE